MRKMKQLLRVPLPLKWEIHLKSIHTLSQLWLEDQQCPVLPSQDDDDDGHDEDDEDDNDDESDATLTIGIAVCYA